MEVRGSDIDGGFDMFFFCLFWFFDDNIEVYVIWVYIFDFLVFCVLVLYIWRYLLYIIEFFEGVLIRNFFCRYFLMF